MVRKAGTATSRSPQSMWRAWLSIIEPMTTRAAAATWPGTIPASGVKKSIAAKTVPVITLAKPVLAPSPTPVADSMKTVWPEAPATPPIMPPAPSTSRALDRPGIRPCLSASPASLPMPMMVAMASKKPARTRVKTAKPALSAPMLCAPKAPNTSMWPKSPKFGAETGLPGHLGTDRPQVLAGRFSAACRISESTVPMAMPIRIAPRTLRTWSTKIDSSVMAKISTGQPERLPMAPSWTGVSECAESGTRLTKPALTRPIRAMNSPMPMVIACLIASGMPFMIISRRPETTMITISRP